METEDQGSGGIEEIQLFYFILLTLFRICILLLDIS